MVVMAQRKPTRMEIICKVFVAVEAGHKKCSAWLIVNRIRWETTIVTKGTDFKISNDFIALYARLFHVRYPEHEGFFKIKKMNMDREWRGD